MAIAEGLDLVVSGSKDGTCVLHALFSGKYLRTIRYRHFGFLLLLALAERKSRLANLHTHVCVRTRHGRCESVVERLGLSGRGEIVICTQEDILLYSINGELLARCPCEDKFTGMQIVPSSSTGMPSSTLFYPTFSTLAHSLTSHFFLLFQTGRPESAFWSPPATTLSSGDWTTLSRFTSSTTISEHRTRLLRPSRRSRSSFSLRRTTRNEGAPGHARMKV